MEVFIIVMMIVVTAAGAVIYYAHAWAGTLGLAAVTVSILALYALYIRRCYRNARSR